MNIILESLIHTLKCINHPIVNEIDKPLDINELKSPLESLKFGHEQNLLTLYQFSNWVDGAKLVNDDYIELSSFGFLLDFSSMISVFLLKKNDNKNWSKKLPLMANKKGDFIVIDLNVKSKNYGKLLACINGDFFFDMTLNSELVTVYDDIPSFIKTIDKCYRTGAYQVDGRLLKIDKEKEREISREINPESEYWK